MPLFVAIITALTACLVLLSNYLSFRAASLARLAAGHAAERKETLGRIEILVNGRLAEVSAERDELRKQATTAQIALRRIEQLIEHGNAAPPPPDTPS